MVASIDKLCEPPNEDSEITPKGKTKDGCLKVDGRESQRRNHAIRLFSGATNNLIYIYLQIGHLKQLELLIEFGNDIASVFPFIPTLSRARTHMLKLIASAEDLSGGFK